MRSQRRACSIVFLACLALKCFAAAGGPMDYDEGIWNYIGRLWLVEGVPPYAGAVENKPPGLFLLYGISNYCFGPNAWFPRLIGCFCSAGTAALLCSIAARWRGPAAGWTAGLLFAVISTLGWVDGMLACQSEWPMIFFVVLALRLTGPGWERPRPFASAFLGGLALGAALNFKQTALADAGGLVLLCGIPLRSKGLPRAVLGGTLGVGLGLAAGIVPLLLSGGTWADYYDGVWRILALPGTAETDPALRFKGMVDFHRFLFATGLLPGVILLAVFWKRIRADVPWLPWLAAWLFLDWLAVNASGRYLRHQLAQIVPPACLVAGLAYATLLEVVRYEARTMLVRAGAVGLALLFLLDKTPLKSAEYLARGRTVKTAPVLLGEFLKAQTAEGERVYLWGDNVNVAYAVSERRAPGRYFNQLFLRLPGAEDEARAALESHPPAWIAVFAAEQERIPRWLKAQVSGYRKDGERFGYVLYRK
ncbi:MAG: glycosyltransferase family 39 protein [Planctomycetota bacterium]|nr:glycosyltransferase family 39 protein [Planctomycetota bacterium]